MVLYYILTIMQPPFYHHATSATVVFMPAATPTCWMGRLQDSGARGDLCFSSPRGQPCLVCWLVSPPNWRAPPSLLSCLLLRSSFLVPLWVVLLRLRLERHVLRRRRSDDATRDVASRHTTTNCQLASPSSARNFRTPASNTAAGRPAGRRRVIT